MIKPRLYASILLWNLSFLIILLVSLEGILRLFDPAKSLPLHGKIADKEYTWGHEVTKNSLGFREREFSSQKAPNTYRLMAIGDSYLFGTGLAEEERFSNKLEEILNSTPSATTFEVLNFGALGANTQKEARILEQHIEFTDPDRILVAFCFNDPQPEYAYQEFDEGRDKLRKRWLFLFNVAKGLAALGFTKTGETLHSSLFWLGEIMGMTPTYEATVEKAYNESSTEWKEFIAALVKIKNISDKHSLPPPIFAVLNHGLPFGEKTNDYDRSNPWLARFFRYWDIAKRTSVSLGFETVDFEDEIRAQLMGQVLSINAKDWHPNALVNQVYAEKLARVVASKPVNSAATF